MDLVDNWKIADDLPSRGTLVQNELGDLTLRVQAESAKGTGAFRQLAGPAERPRLTFDVKTGVEVPTVGRPLRLESNVSSAAPSPATTFTVSVKGPFSVAVKEERIVMPGEFASNASSTGLGKVFTKPVDEIYADVYAVPKANRPPVETYMSKPAIDAHVAQFDDGASRFMTQSNLSKYGPAQADGTAFVMTRKQADKLLADARGDAAKFEQALGLPADTLSTNPMNDYARDVKAGYQVDFERTLGNFDKVSGRTGSVRVDSAVGDAGGNVFDSYSKLFNNTADQTYKRRF